MEEKSAITRLQTGDITGLEFLVRQYQVKAVYAAYLILQDRALAEEVVQNAFLKVVDKIHLYDDGRPFAPWFFRIVSNDALKMARAQNRLQSLEEEAVDVSHSLAIFLIDPQPHLESQAETRETVQDLRRAMLLLSPEQRAVVVMRYYLQMGEKEMAGKLEKPISTVKWWLRTARKQLGRTINPDSHPASDRRLK